MMERAWKQILARYGQTVRVEDGQGRRDVRAFLQPVRERSGVDRVQEAYGLRSSERWLYFGPEDVPLEAGRTWVVWKEQRFMVCRSAPAAGSHWWALLRRADEEE